MKLRTVKRLKSDYSPTPNKHISPYSPLGIVHQPGSREFENTQPSCPASTLIPEAGGLDMSIQWLGGEGRVGWTLTAPQSKSTSPLKRVCLKFPTSVQHGTATASHGSPGFKQWLLCVSGSAQVAGPQPSNPNPTPPPPPPPLQQLESFSDMHAWKSARGATR